MHCESEWLCVGVKGIEGAGMLAVGNEKGGGKNIINGKENEKNYSQYVRKKFTYKLKTENTEEGFMKENFFSMIN